MVLRYQHYDAVMLAGYEESQVYVSIRLQLHARGEVRTKKTIAQAAPKPRRNLLSIVPEL